MSGTVTMERPTLAPPLVEDDVSQYLTSYFWRDDSRYTIMEYDYRLRWTLTYGPSGRPSQYVIAKVELWNWSTGTWNELWTLDPVGDDHRSLYMQQQLVRQLASKANAILFGSP